MTHLQYTASDDLVNTQCFFEVENPRTFFAMVPSIIYRIGLSPGAMALYGYYLSIGRCFKCQKTIAAETGISVRTQSDLNRELSEKREIFGGRPLIHIISRKKPDGSKDTNLVLILDIWSENEAFFNKSLQSAKSAGGVRQNLPEGPAKSADKEYSLEEDKKKSVTAAPSGIISKKGKDGEMRIDQSDILRQLMIEKINFQTDHFKEAWKVLADYEGVIYDSYLFIKQVLENIITKQKSENIKKAQACNSRKNNKNNSKDTQTNGCSTTSEEDMPKPARVSFLDVLKTSEKGWSGFEYLRTS